MKNQLLVKTIYITLVAALLVGPNSAEAQTTTFGFEDLTLPAIGFNNGDPNFTSDLAAIGAVVDITSVTPEPFGPTGGVVQQIDQTFTISAGGAELTLPNSYSEAIGFDDFFFGFSFSNVQDVTTPGPGNLYASFANGGANGSSNYLVGSGDTFISANSLIESIDIAPTTFTALAILNGDDGGNNFVSGSLSDLNGFFELIISGNNSTDTITVPFGDFRAGASINPSNVFETIDVSSLNSDTLNFAFDGDDVLVTAFGDFLNTPLFFAADNIVVSVPEPSSLAILAIFGGLGMTRRRRSHDSQCAQ